MREILVMMNSICLESTRDKVSELYNCTNVNLWVCFFVTLYYIYSYIRCNH